jgi:hypothetical protein
MFSFGLPDDIQKAVKDEIDDLNQRSVSFDPEPGDFAMILSDDDAKLRLSLMRNAEESDGTGEAEDHSEIHEYYRISDGAGPAPLPSGILIPFKIGLEIFHGEGIFTFRVRVPQEIRTVMKEEFEQLKHSAVFFDRVNRSLAAFLCDDADNLSSLIHSIDLIMRKEENRKSDDSLMFA